MCIFQMVVCSPWLSRKAESVMNEGSVNRNPQNLHKFAYSQFGFQYWSLFQAGYIARLPLHLSRPHKPHYECPFCVFLTFFLFILLLVLEIFCILHCVCVCDKLQWLDVKYLVTIYTFVFCLKVYYKLKILVGDCVIYSSKCL